MEFYNNKNFNSSFDVIQENALLSQFKFNAERSYSVIAQYICTKIGDSSENTTFQLNSLTNKKTANILSVQFTAADSTTKIDNTLSSSLSFEFYYAGINQSKLGYDSADIEEQCLKLLLKFQFYEYKQHILDPDTAYHLSDYVHAVINDVSAKIYTYSDSEAIYSNELTRGISHEWIDPTLANKYESNTLTATYIAARLNNMTNDIKETDDENLYFKNGDIFPKDTVKFQIKFTNKLKSYYETIIHDYSNAVNILKTCDSYKNALKNLRIFSYNDVIHSNTMFDSVFSMLIDFFRDSKTFNKIDNFASNIIYLYNNMPKPTVIGDEYSDEYAAQGIGLLKKLENYQLINLQTMTSNSVFKVHKFSTTKRKQFITEGDSLHQKILGEIIQPIMTNETSPDANQKNIMQDLLINDFMQIIADSSTNKIDDFLQRYIGSNTNNPNGNSSLITYQQLYNFFYFSAKILENIKNFSFTIYFKHSTTYLYKNSILLTTIYPDTPFTNTDVDEYYQALLEGPLFLHTAVNLALLNQNTSTNYNTISQNDYYSNFFEILYDSQTNFAKGKITQPYNLKSSNLIYSTLESHNESPTFDVYDKNGSNGVFQYFANYMTSTYDLKSQINDIFEVFGIKQNGIITKKSVLYAFYMLISKWHENIRTLHCNYFCCHANCHGGQYFSTTTSEISKINDSAIPINIYVNYRFFGFNSDGSEIPAEQTETVENQIISDMIRGSCTLPANEIITTWSSSRLQKNNTYTPSADRLKLKVKFPSYHGSGNGIQIYAEYRILNYFDVTKDTKHHYEGTATGSYPIRIYSPYALLGVEKQLFEETYIIQCEDRLDATDEITDLGENFISAGWYQTYSGEDAEAHFATTHINFESEPESDLPINKMLSCIPLSIDVCYKSTFGEDLVSQGEYLLGTDVRITLNSDYEKFTVFPDTVHTQVIYTGTNSGSMLTDSTTLGIKASNHSATYYATHYQPSLDKCTCQICTNHIKNKWIDLTAWYNSGPNILELTEITIDNIIQKECHVVYSNSNGAAGTSDASITITAKSTSTMFRGSMTLNYTVNTAKRIELSDTTKVHIEFDSSDVADGIATSFNPRVVCYEDGLSDHHIADELLLRTQATDGQNIIVTIVPNSTNCGDVYFQGSTELTCSLPVPDDDDDEPTMGSLVKYDDFASIQWAWNKKDEGIGTATKEVTINIADISTLVPLRIKITAKIQRQSGGTTHGVAGTVAAYVNYVNSEGSNSLCIGCSGYSVRGSSAHHSTTSTFYYSTVLPVSELVGLESLKCQLVGDIMSPNHDHSRTMWGEVACNRPEV